MFSSASRSYDRRGVFETLLLQYAVAVLRCKTFLASERSTQPGPAFSPSLRFCCVSVMSWSLATFHVAVAPSSSWQQYGNACPLALRSLCGGFLKTDFVLGGTGVRLTLLVH